MVNITKEETIMERQWAIYVAQAAQPVFEGDFEELKELMEEGIENETGIMMMIETDEEAEDEDGNEYFAFYLHSDNEEDRTEEELQQMEEEYGLKVQDSIKNQHDAICKMMHIVKIEEV